MAWRERERAVSRLRLLTPAFAPWAFGSSDHKRPQRVWQAGSQGNEKCCTGTLESALTFVRLQLFYSRRGFCCPVYALDQVTDLAAEKCLPCQSNRPRVLLSKDQCFGARSQFCIASSWHSIPAVPLVVASAPLALALVGSSAHTSQSHQMLDALVKLATCSATRQQADDRYLSHRTPMLPLHSSNLPIACRALQVAQVARQLAPFPYTHVASTLARRMGPL